MSISILVTGGAGYIGSVLVPLLLSEGYKVTVVDNFMYRQASLNSVCSNPNFSVIHGDIRNTDMMKHALRASDIVIPLAAYVGAPLCERDPLGAKSVNYDAPLKMFELLSRNQVVIMPTTNSAYGMGGLDNYCTEETPLNPISNYAVHKVEIEKQLMKLEHWISFRLATVFGMSPRMRLDLLVNDLTYRACTDGCVTLFESSYKRNYIHVQDVCNAFLHAITNMDVMQRQIYNVGLSSANISKLELCELIKSKIPKFVITESSYRSDPDQRNYVVSNSKIERTGFQPKQTLPNGIEELIKGYSMLRNSRYSNV